MKLLLFFISLCTILLILISSPKSSSINNLMNQDKLIELTNSNQLFLQKIIMVSILLFLILTTYLAIYSNN